MAKQKEKISAEDKRKQSKAAKVPKVAKAAKTVSSADRAAQIQRDMSQYEAVHGRDGQMQRDMSQYEAVQRSNTPKVAKVAKAPKTAKTAETVSHRYRASQIKRGKAAYEAAERKRALTAQGVPHSGADYGFDINNVDGATPSQGVPYSGANYGFNINNVDGGTRGVPHSGANYGFDINNVDRRTRGVPHSGANYGYNANNADGTPPPSEVPHSGANYGYNAKSVDSTPLPPPKVPYSGANYGFDANNVDGTPIPLGDRGISPQGQNYSYNRMKRSGLVPAVETDPYGFGMGPNTASEAALIESHGGSTENFGDFTKREGNHSSGLSGLFSGGGSDGNGDWGMLGDLGQRFGSWTGLTDELGPDVGAAAEIQAKLANPNLSNETAYGFSDAVGDFSTTATAASSIYGMYNAHKMTGLYEKNMENQMAQANKNYDMQYGQIQGQMTDRQSDEQQRYQRTATSLNNGNYTLNSDGTSTITGSDGKSYNYGRNNSQTDMSSRVAAAKKSREEIYGK